MLTINLSRSLIAGVSHFSERRRSTLPSALCASLLALVGTCAQAATPLSDQALFTATPVPGNLALALSVEYPTAVSVAHIGSYTNTTIYLGYFDPKKCYSYKIDASDTTAAPNATPGSYFYPDGATDAVYKCTGKWSGNFLNWATTQTIDPFRWALTGGHRALDTETLTVLEKAWASGQGGTGNFPDRSIDLATTGAGATPLNAVSLGTGTVWLRVMGQGNKLRFSSSKPNVISATVGIHYDNTGGTANTIYEVFGRVKVCDSNQGLEANCKAYGANYKPEGLIQKYSDKIRYSALGYLNDSNILRDGGVLRARQKYVAPTIPAVGITAAGVNSAREWDATTGVFIGNPNATDSADTATLFGVTVDNSGVINYLNKFGRDSKIYKSTDPVGELYYAAIRYFKNLGNVPEWTATTGSTLANRTTWVDGFPVITNWDDPIQYSCQRNFILGIGDVNTHADGNVPGKGTGTVTTNEPATPSFGDTINAIVATNRVGVLEGLGASLGTTNPYGGCCNNNTARMAGLAYDAHTRDIRPDVLGQAKTIGKQTISTYWLDVMEYQTLKANNQFLLAAKYGGFEVPDGFDPDTRTTALPTSWWHTTSDTLPITGALRPDNYFTAGAPDQMVKGLNAAFSDIAGKIKAYTTSFSTTLPQVSQLGNGSYSAQFDANGWTGELRANVLDFNPATGVPTLSPTPSWLFTDELAAQASGSGWNTNRRIASWDPVSKTAVAFRASGGSKLTTTQLAALDTAYTAGDDSTNFLNYLRGDRTHEVGSTVAGSTKAYRSRTKLLGDIEGSKAVPVGPPAYPFTDDNNPGYGAFQSTWTNRRTVVYVGSNDGMLHAVNGALQKTLVAPLLETDAKAGEEMFAYIPSALLNGPNSTPSVDGLAALGQPSYAHKYFVNATPVTFDVDFGHTWDVGTLKVKTGPPNWRTILVGGLGKGGKSYYALDVTDPQTMAGSEANTVSKVLWEFTDPDMGYSYGDPLITKTQKYGWVVVLVSGYNNADGYGYFYFINPETGALLEKVKTPTYSTGLAQVNGYIASYRDGTTDALYAGDLDGNLWRLDVTAKPASYPTPIKFATLTDADGVAQPITAKPIAEVNPRNQQRFIMVGTGKALHTSDISSTQKQTFYGITDGNSSFGGFAAAPSPPLGKANLQPITNVLTGDTIDYLTKRGWYLELGSTTPPSPASPKPYRVVFRPTSYYGAVTFVGTALDTDDPCLPAGDSIIYGLDFSNGKTQILNAVTNLPLPYLKTGATVTDVKDLSVDGKRVLVYGDDKGGLGRAATEPAPGQTSRRLSWREIQTDD